MTDEPIDLPGDGLDEALRVELSSLHVRFDEHRLDEMISAATDVQPLGARSWQAPLAAAAAIVVVGSGAALIATHQSGHDADAGGGPGGCVPSSSPAGPSATSSTAVEPTPTTAEPTPTTAVPTSTGVPSYPKPSITARATRVAAGATPTPGYNDFPSPEPSGSGYGWYAYVPCATSGGPTPSFTNSPTVDPGTTTTVGTPTRTQPPPSPNSTGYAPPSAAPAARTTPIRLRATPGSADITQLATIPSDKRYLVSSIAVTGGGGAYRLRLERTTSIATSPGEAARPDEPTVVVLSGRGAHSTVSFPSPQTFTTARAPQFVLQCTGSTACSVDLVVHGRLVSR